MNPFFQAIQSTNRAYCAAHGLSATEEELAKSNARMMAAMARDEKRHTERFGSGVRNSWAGD